MPPQPSSEEALVASAQRGDRDAYANLVHRYRDLALGTAFVILGDRQDAEDVVQEAFTRAFVAMPRFRPDGSFRSWLLRIVANQARTLRKASQRQADVLARASADVPTLRPAPSAEVAALAEGRREAVLRALFDLSERDRLVITYRYFFDMSEEETAAALGLARGTIKSRLARALGRLRPILRDLGPLAVTGPAIEHLLREVGGAGLLHPGGQAGQASLGARLAPEAPPSRQASLQNALTGAAAAFVATVAVAAALAVGPDTARMDRLPSATEAQAFTPAAPMARAIIYGGDLTNADRQELTSVFGTESNANVLDTIPRQELVDALTAHGLQASLADEAISSVAVTCVPPGTGLRVRTENITRISAANYAAALEAAGLHDASVMVAAPASKPVSGETALVGALKAASACTGAPPDQAQVDAAFSQLGAADLSGYRVEQIAPNEVQTVRVSATD